MDAVPMRLGSEFRAFAVTVGEDIDRLNEFSGLLREVNLGGTAIGTGINAPKGYSVAAIRHLSRISGVDLIPAGDLIEATSDMGAFVTFSGVLKRIAVKLSKICNDLRLPGHRQRPYGHNRSGSGTIAA
jgi:aspartate ammonia-lyase